VVAEAAVAVVVMEKVVAEAAATVDVVKQKLAVLILAHQLILKAVVVF
jgi:hypothetical protein